MQIRSGAARNFRVGGSWRCSEERCCNSIQYMGLKGVKSDVQPCVSDGMKMTLSVQQIICNMGHYLSTGLTHFFHFFSVMCECCNGECIHFRPRGVQFYGDRQTDRHTDRQTDRLTEWSTHTHIHMPSHGQINYKKYNAKLDSIINSLKLLNTIKRQRSSPGLVNNLRRHVHRSTTQVV